MQILFVAIALTSIAAGGTLSAFRARNPSRKAMWASAYLVLVTGLLQLGLAQGIPAMTDRLGVGVTLGLMAAYNIGSFAVIIGTVRKNHIGWRNPAVVGSLLITAVVMIAAVGVYGVATTLDVRLFYSSASVLVVTSLIGAIVALRQPG